MKPMCQPDVLRCVVDRTREVFPRAERVLLFGSRARGDARPDSDYDLLVVVPDLPARAGRSVALRLALRGLGVAFDILVLTPREFRELQQSRAQLAGAMLRDAVVLHEAA